MLRPDPALLLSSFVAEPCAQDETRASAHSVLDLDSWGTLAVKSMGFALVGKEIHFRGFLGFVWPPKAQRIGWRG